MKKFIYSCIALLVLTPFTTFAAQDIGSLEDLVSKVGHLMNSMIPLLFGLALLTFFWGIIKYIYEGGKGNQDAVKSARSYMIFSIVGIAVMLSVWGLALFLKNSFFPESPCTFNVGSCDQSSGNNSIGGDTSGNSDNSGDNVIDSTGQDPG